MGGLKLDDLSWGTLNNIRDSRQDQPSGDPRRTSTTTSMRRSATAIYEPDALGFRAEYLGFVMSARQIQYPTYQNKGSLLQEYVIQSSQTTPAGSTSESDETSQYENIAYKVYIPEIEPRPAPKGQDDPVLRSYPDVFSELPGKEAIPLGSLVAVRYEDANHLYNPQIVRIIERAVGIENISVDPNGNALSNVFFNGEPSVLGGSSSRKDNLTFTLKEGLPEGSPGQRVVGEHINTPGQESLRRIVENELAFWNGRKEDSGDMDGDGVNETDARIQMYNDSVFSYQGDSRQHVIKKDGKYFHWSAIYISYVISRIVPFPQSTAHTLYAQGAKAGKEGWTLWMTGDAGSGEGADPGDRKGQYKIQANVGDVLVQPPVGRWDKNTNSHGDAVYKIENGKAWLTGGNLSNTAIGNFWLPVDADGNYSSYGSSRKPSNPYQIILKYKGKFEGTV